MKVDADGNITLDGQIYASDNLDFNGTVTLSTNANGILLTSGSYIPLSFTLWTDTNEGYVDWLHTVLLQDVKAYDEYGNPLDSTQYTLLSRNGDFFDFTNQMPSTPVPEPISMLLFGTGIVGVGGYIRKRFKQN